ncbi:MAG: HNH endonuclease signature motif containing protein [Anaeromyxobacter sp.]
MAEAEQGGWVHLPKVEAALLALEIEFDDADDAKTTASRSAQLRVEVAEEQAAQLRAASKVSAVLPEHLALLLAAAVFNARAKFGTNLSMGRCLAIMSAHFLVTWEQQGKQRKTRSQEIRARDDGRCQVPGCSHASAHAHHIVPRSQGGSDDPENLVGLCSFHHLVGVHGGYLEVYREPVTKALVWLRQGQLFTGRPEADPLPVARA